MRTTGVRIASRHLGRRLAKDGSAWAGEAVEVTGGARAAYHARLRHNLRECRSGHPEVIEDVGSERYLHPFLFSHKTMPGIRGCVVRLSGALLTE